MLVGEDQRYFLPVSAIAGAIILSAASTLAKALARSLEVEGLTQPRMSRIMKDKERISTVDLMERIANRDNLIQACRRVRASRPDLLMLLPTAISDTALLIQKMNEFGLGNGRLPTVSNGAAMGDPDLRWVMTYVQAGRRWSRLAFHDLTARFVAEGYAAIQSTRPQTLAYALTDPSVSSVLIRASDTERLNMLSLVPDRDMPPGLDEHAAQLEEPEPGAGGSKLG